MRYCWVIFYQRVVVGQVPSSSTVWRVLLIVVVNAIAVLQA